MLTEMFWGFMFLVFIVYLFCVICDGFASRRRQREYDARLDREWRDAGFLMGQTEPAAHGRGRQGHPRLVLETNSTGTNRLVGAGEAMH